MKALRLIFGIFTVLGVVFLIIGAATYLHTRRFLDTAVAAEGVVLENLGRMDNSSNNYGSSRYYYPRIRFRTADGQDISFVSSSGSNPPSYSINETVKILYDPGQPDRAMVHSFVGLWLLPTIFGGIGAVFASIGLVAIVVKSLNDRKNNWLEQNGRRIQADITRVELNTSLEVNGANPFRIVCQWFDPAANQMHIFHSANIWYDPSRFLSGKTIEVLIDPNNPHRYLVETSFLPKVV